MKIKDLLKLRENRDLRGYTCLDNFIKMSLPCIDTAAKILKKEYNYDEDFLLERSTIITYVSAVEIFYKDYLNLILKFCNKDFVQKNLKEIHQNKYDINDLIEIDEHSISPYELVLGNISFQNIESIEKVFSKFLEKKGFWNQLNGMKLRFNKDDKNQLHFNPNSINSLQEIFKLRHELVHDPVKTNFLDEKLYESLDNSISCIIMSHIILSNLIAKNLDQSKN